MPLTHYGEVTGLGRLFALLRRSIQGLAQLALSQVDVTVDRVAHLRTLIMQGWLEEIASHGVSLSQKDSMALLAVDAELNAQGLDVWLQRLQKAKHR